MMIGMGSRGEIDRAVDFIEGRLPADYRPDISHKRIRVDEGDCEGCGACVARCPNQAMRFSEQKGTAEVDPRRCLTCGYSAPVCPTRAILLY